MKKLLIFLHILFLGGFPLAKSQESQSGSPSTVSQETTIDSSFFYFLDHFIGNMEFQKSRIKFPIKNEGKKIASQKDWKHLVYSTKNEHISLVSSQIRSPHKQDIKSEQVELYFVNLVKKLASKQQFIKNNQKWFLTDVAKLKITTVPDNYFINFLTSFATDTAFQRQHICFPLSKAYVNTNGDYETIAVKIKKDDWVDPNLMEQFSSLLMLSAIDENNKFRNVLCRGVNNGTWLKYTFENRAGTWMLILFEDYST